MANQNICEVELLTNVTTNTNAIVEENGSCRRVNLIDVIYPVGSIYMSINNVDPSVLFGGTWEKIKDRFLLSAGDTYVANTEGGESEHTLTVNEIPSHNHGFLDYWSTTKGASTDTRYAVAVNGDSQGIESDKLNTRSYTANTGGGAAHNNMPPYLVVNIYKRVS